MSISKEQRVHEEHVLEHRNKVKNYAKLITAALLERVEAHDISKLSPPEIEAFSANSFGEHYGTEDYHAKINKLKGALEHHYKHNRHHPEHFENGIQGMHIIDILEMLCDWLAASTNEKNSNMLNSVAHNKSRFNMSNDLYSIFKNTITDFLKKIRRK